MARTIAEIQQSIIDAKNADPVLFGLSSRSNVAIWRLWTYVVAVCQWTLEKLFDAHKVEVSNIIGTMKPHTLQWYVLKAKAYQHGDNLPDGSDTYAVIDTTKRIVVHAAASEDVSTKRVRIKAAKLDNTNLAALSDTEQSGLATYMKLIRDAGVRLEVISKNADILVLEVTIYYDALVLAADGSRLDGTNDVPVKDAIRNYLKNLPFNGLLVLAKMVDALQEVDGVVIPHITKAQASDGPPASLSLKAIEVEYQPAAGYITIADVNLTINYVPHEPI